MTRQSPVVAAKLQHHVFYVSDLDRSKQFYTNLFDLQFSALNHPDSSAAMRLAQQEMHFFSFGFHHHDLCLVKHRKFVPDNESMLHFTLVLRDGAAYDAVRRRALAMAVAIREGRMLPLVNGRRAGLCVRDPDAHWIEIVEER